MDAKKTTGTICYHIMYRDECVADVIMEPNHLVRKIIKYIPDSPKQPFWGDMEHRSPQYLTDRFYVFLQSRCYEDCRADLPMILEQAGLSSNDPYAWVRISHGVTYEDFFWVKIDDEKLTWKDVAIR